MNLNFLKNYSKILINLRWMDKNKIHPIINWYYLQIRQFCRQNNIKLVFLNEWNKWIYSEAINKTIFSKIKNFLLSNATLFLPTINKIPSKKWELIITDNQFLITNWDYIVFLDWVHSFTGYNAKWLYNPYMKYLIRYFISRPNLKYLIIATKTWLQSIINYLWKDFYEKYKNKFIVEYPKLLIDKNYLEKLKSKRKENLKKQNYKSFLFIWKDFIRKWWIETIIAIYELYKEWKINTNTHKFTFITKKIEIPNFILKKYKELEKQWIIKHFEPQFKTEEIYEKFYTTHKVFLLPTRWDPFWMVFLEAKAFDMEVITTDQWPAREIFEGYDKVKFIEFIEGKNKWHKKNNIPKYNTTKLLLDFNNLLNIDQIKNFIK